MNIYFSAHTYNINTNIKGFLDFLLIIFNKTKHKHYTQADQKIEEKIGSLGQIIVRIGIPTQIYTLKVKFKSKQVKT